LGLDYNFWCRLDTTREAAIRYVIAYVCGVQKFSHLLQMAPLRQLCPIAEAHRQVFNANGLV